MITISDAIQAETDCERARKWADYLKVVAKTAISAALVIIVATAIMVLLAFWLFATNQDGQAVSSGAGAVATGSAAGLVFRKAQEFKSNAETAESHAAALCSDTR